MTNLWSPQFLSDRSRQSFDQKIASTNVIDDSFSSTFTTFNQVGNDEPSEASHEVTATMRAEIAKVLDKLDVVVVQVLKEREAAEQSATKWITIGGAVIVILLLTSALAPLFTDAGVLPSVFSSLSVGGLLILLYSPVRERLNIANDRSNLLLMTQGFRLQFAVANTVEQLQALGRELSAALRISSQESNLR